MSPTSYWDDRRNNHSFEESNHSWPANDDAHAGGSSSNYDEKEQLPSSSIVVTDDDMVSPAHVMRRIESMVAHILQDLHHGKLPTMCTVVSTTTDDENDDDTASHVVPTKRLTLQQSRSFTSILLVASYCHALLQCGRTATIREVYYVFVTHFRHQEECNAAILQLSNLLGLSRAALGLFASPKGWFCGSVVVANSTTPSSLSSLDCRTLPHALGMPITSEWLTGQRTCILSHVNTAPPAKAVLVVEKQGIYQRLVQDRIWARYPCIVVTGRGVPDLATRALVHALHVELQLPVCGLADCNPFGVSVLHTYVQGSASRTVDGGDRYSVPMEWLGLRPSQLQHLSSDLPAAVWQQLTALDHKRLQSLQSEQHRWTNCGRNEARLAEMHTLGRHKVELEALYWLGMDYITDWAVQLLEYQDRTVGNGSDNDDDIASEKDIKPWMAAV